MITKALILELHYLSVEKYGGAHGLRDEGLLDSALGRAYQTFDREELYPTPLEKAAALHESIIVNHPFVDGNKRTGLLAMTSILELHGLIITASEEAVYNFTINVSTGAYRFEQMVRWLRENTTAQ